MDVRNDLAALAQKGVDIWIDENDRIAYRDPGQTMTVSDRKSVESHQAQISKQLKKGRFISTTYPLSAGQEALWFIYKTAPESPAYNTCPLSCRIRFKINPSDLEETFQAMVNRHACLRTLFSIAEDGRTVQHVYAYKKAVLERIDASGTTEAQLGQLAKKAYSTPFDLEHDIPVKLFLLSRSDQDHVLVMTLHHIVDDAVSGIIFREDFQDIYTAKAGGDEIRLPVLNRSYQDFVQIQNDWIDSPRGASDLAYWKEQLAGNFAPLDLPLDHPRPPVPTFQGATRNFTIDALAGKKINALSKALQKSLLRIFLTAYTILLHRYTAQDNIVVGIPASVRPMPEFKGVSGYFVTMLPIRADLAGNPDFTTLLAQISQTTSSAIRHIKYPFPAIVKKLKIDHSLSVPPIFQSSFTLYDRELTPLLKGAGMTLNQNRAEAFQIEQQEGQFDLAVSVYNTGDKFTGAFKFNTALFKDDTINQMIGHFKVLLSAIAENPDQPISDFPLLTDEERHKILVGFNNTKADYPGDSCVHELFERQAKLMPDAPAVMFGEAQMTYGELNRRANQLGWYLRRLGIGPESLVGICMERSVDMIVGILGILKAGGAYVPVDPGYPAERIALMLEDADASVVLTQDRFRPLLPETGAAGVCLDREWDVIGRESQSNLECLAAPGNLAYVIYTSGSTGTPKGTAIPHEAIVPLVTHTDYIRITPGDRMGHASNVSFDAATFEIWGALANGAAIVGISRDTALSPSRLAACIRERRISILFLTTALFNQIAELNPTAFSTLIYLLFGGEAVNPSRVKRILDTAPPENLLHMYGPTETTTYATWHRISRVPEDARTIPIGKPLANKYCYILDASGLPVPVGVAGELHIGGAGIARGYLNRPRLTEEAFIPDPFSELPGSRIYRTGDLCRYLPDGAIEFVGRRDLQVKIRGFRIEPGEIERILGSHEKVKETIVIVHEAPSGDRQIVAYLVSRKCGAPVTQEEVRKFLEIRLPGYMIPALFIILEALPLTPNGKIDRRALPEPDAGLNREHGIVPPANETEEIISGIWKEMLNLDAISVHDNFFRMGGHSLLAVGVVSRMEEIFGTKISIRKLFELPTIRELSREVARASSRGDTEAYRRILPSRGHSSCGLSLTQQRLWYLSEMEGGMNSTYNVPMSCRVTGHLDIEAVKWALDEIVSRHEVLRMIITDAGEPVRVSFPPLSLDPPVVDLRTTKDPREAALQLASREAMTPFDLTCGPFTRAKILRLDDQEFLLLITVHHLIFDGWSSGVFFQEFQGLYRAFVEDRQPDLPDLDIQYPDFARWQEKEFGGDRLKRHLDYWKEYLAGSPTLLEPPVDLPRGPVQTFSGDSVRFELEAGLAEQVKTLAQQSSATLFMTLHAAFATLLMKYTGKEDMIIGTLMANRNHRQVEPLIGFFGNLLPLRADLSGDPSFTILMDRVKQSVVGAYTHQELPFKMLLDGLGIKRDRQHPPLFQVVFDSPNIGRFGESFKVGGAKFTILDLEVHQVTKYDLDVSVEERDGKIRGIFVYNTDLFYKATIAMMKDRFVALLSEITAAPHKRLSQFLAGVSFT